MADPVFDPSKPFKSADPVFDPGQPFIQEEQEPGLLAKAGGSLLSGLSSVGKTIDSYTGAPTRSAIGKLQDDFTDLRGAASAFKNQFGDNPEKAPTGKDIVKRAGVPDTSLSEVAPSLYGDGKLTKGGLLDPTASGVAGFAMDVAADPTMVLPVTKIARPIAETVRGATKAGVRAATAAGEAASNAGRKVSVKLGNLLSGVPEKEIDTYIKNYPEVQKIIKDFGDNMPDAADKIREGFQSSIRAKRAELSGSIDKALKAIPDERSLELNKILKTLEDSKASLMEKKQLEEAQQIANLSEKVKSFSVEKDIYGASQITGKVTPKELNSIKGMLQDVASAAYVKDGQIFTTGSAAQKAAKAAGAEARKLLNTVSPTIAKANNELSQLHVIEQKMNKNLIAPGKPESALLAAGSGMNQRNIRNLERLQDITGSKIMENAENLAAARRFASPGWTAADSTGKGLERAGKGGLIGGFIGGVPGAVIGASITSPAALKAAIQAGRIPVEAVRSLTGTAGKLTSEGIEKAYQILNTPQGMSAFDNIVRGARAISVGGEEIPRGLLKTADRERDRRPAKGNK